jgi:hypothetical protein
MFVVRALARSSIVVGVAPAVEAACGFRAVVATWALTSDVLASSGRKKKIERFGSIKAKVRRVRAALASAIIG